MSTVKERFDRQVERLKKMGLEVTMEEKQPDACFGKTTTAIVSVGCTYLAWSLKEAGGICRKRTSISSFAMVNGKRTTTEMAMLRIRAELVYGI